MTTEAKPSSFAAIHPRVHKHLPAILSEHLGAFDVRTYAFSDVDADNETVQMFAVEVYTDAERVEPTDRRMSAYTQAAKTTYFFDANGDQDGDVERTITRYQ